MATAMGSKRVAEEEDVRFPVFTDTNLGTHFAMSISPDITVPEFKRELENKHLRCFPDIGEIRVNTLMVKRKSRLYHLSESFPLKYAFLDFERAYFFYIEACHQSSCGKVGNLSERVAEKVPETTCNDSSKSNNTECKRKKRRYKRFHCLRSVIQVVLRARRLSKKRKKKKKCRENNFVQNYPSVHGLERLGLLASKIESELGQDWNFSPLDETPRPIDTSSESVSVSGIIKKYFSNSDELTSSSSEVNFAGIRTWPEEQLKFGADNNCLGPQMDTPPEYSATTPPEIIVFTLPTHSSSKTSTGVGKRLLIASNNLRISRSKQKPAISLCSRFVPRSSFVRSLVFDISGEDD